MSSTELQIVRKSATLRLLVEDKLRSAIATGRFKPGQRLIERELCELTGVGRTSIREALRQLEAEGLVTTIPHRGPSVSTISLDEARQLYSVRALLEGHAGREFAKRRVPEDLRDLGLAVKHFVQAAKSDDRAELIKAKTEFYSALMRGGGNMFVEQMLTTMHNRITLLRLTSMTSKGRLKNSVAEIKAIHDAIREGDPDRAEASCVKHIEEAAKVALRVLASTEAVATVDA
jgi:DNA-binding GntR family transcriptional regulator